MSVPACRMEATGHALAGLTKAQWILSASPALRHARAQLRHTSTHFRQCLWCFAWRKHSSSQLRQTSAQVSNITSITVSSRPVLSIARFPARETRRIAKSPVAKHTSAQSKFTSIQLRSSSSLSSPRQASAQALHVSAIEAYIRGQNQNIKNIVGLSVNPGVGT
jgi:hypothetical protein